MNVEDFKTPEQLSEWMISHIEYDHLDTQDPKWHLKNPNEVLKDMSGCCHSQSYFIKYWLDKMGYRTKLFFMIEYKGDKIYDAGKTHTLCTFIKDNKIYWFENAWHNQAGIHGPYKNESELKANVYRLWKPIFDKFYNKLYFGEAKIMPYGSKFEDYVAAQIPKNLLDDKINEAAFSIDSIDHTKSTNVVKAVLDKLSETQREYVLGNQSIEKPCLTLVVAYNGKDPVGYCKINSKKNYDGYGYIEIAVVPIYQRHGIGRQLVSKAISETKAQYKDIKLIWTTTIDNEASMKAANKCGFKQVNANAGSNIRRYMYTEACKDVATARQFVSDVGKLAKKYDANYFIVTDGASGIHNNGNEAVRHARQSQIEWEKAHGADPNEDWSKGKSSVEEGWRADLPDRAFGIPEDRKFPLNDARHVKSAIHLFGHAPAAKKKSLARRIASAARRYGIKIPDTTQVYKYLHESSSMEYYTFGPGKYLDDNMLMLTVYTDNEIRNMPTSRIHHWFVGPDKFTNDIPSPWYKPTYVKALSEFARNYGNCDMAYVYIPINALLLKENEPVPDGTPSIIVASICMNPNDTDVCGLKHEFPIRVTQDGILHGCYDESAVCALSAVNPIVGMGGQLHYLIGTNSNQPGREFIYANDPNADKGLIINDEEHLEVVECANLAIPEVAYRFIGSESVIRKLADLYARDQVVSESNLYSLFTGKEMYSEDQIEFDPNFKKVDLDLLECKLETSTATLLQGLSRCMNEVYTECSLEPLTVNMPKWVEKYNTCNDIVMREDADGYYFYSELSHKRTASVREYDALTENMVISIM